MTVVRGERPGLADDSIATDLRDASTKHGNATAAARRRQGFFSGAVAGRFGFEVRYEDLPLASVTPAHQS